MKPSILIRGEIVVGDAPVGAKVFAVGTGIEGAHRRDESQTIGGGHVTAAPLLGQGERGLIIHQPGIGGGQSVSPEVMLLYPMQPSTSKSGMIALLNGPQADITGLTEKNG